MSVENEAFAAALGFEIDQLTRRVKELEEHAGALVREHQRDHDALCKRIVALERKAHTHYYAPDPDEQLTPVESGIPTVDLKI